MAKDKFTPGPWTECWLDDDNGWVMGGGDKYLAQIVTKDECGLVATRGQQVANARLMAAAPTLLAACQVVLKIIEDLPLVSVKNVLNAALLAAIGKEA